MNYNNPNPMKAASILRYSCGLLFALFSFTYLYYMEGDLLAQAQFVFSNGVTHYNKFIGAVIITACLLGLQHLVSKYSKLPEILYAFTYLPSAIILKILTDISPSTLDSFSFGVWTFLFPLFVIAYVFGILAYRNMPPLSFIHQEREVIETLWPNYTVLLLQILFVGSFKGVNDVYTYEIHAETYITEGEFRKASRVAGESLQTSARLNQLRCFALACEGELGDRLFLMPQEFGTLGLLDVNDTLGTHQRFSTQNICAALGARTNETIHSTEGYLLTMLKTDSVRKDRVKEYLLCYYLLDKDLKTFMKHLPAYNNAASDLIDYRYVDFSDSLRLAQCIDSIPRAYREAIVSNMAKQKQDMEDYPDTIMVKRYNEYQEMRQTITDGTERKNRTRRQFGNTFWWYLDYL